MYRCSRPQPIILTVVITAVMAGGIADPPIAQAQPPPCSLAESITPFCPVSERPFVCAASPIAVDVGDADGDGLLDVFTLHADTSIMRPNGQTLNIPGLVEVHHNTATADYFNPRLSYGSLTGCVDFLLSAISTQTGSRTWRSFAKAPAVSNTCSRSCTMTVPEPTPAC